MMKPSTSLVYALAFLLLATPASTMALAQPRSPAVSGITVDLELVLAVDVSHSMDREEQRLQRMGYVNALRHKSVVRAIRRGPNRKIAVAYLEWGDPDYQKIVMPWRVISSEIDAKAFAAELALQPIGIARRTSISAGLRFAARMFDANKFNGLRRVIDISGDGPNNIGEPVNLARRDVVANEITINGLPFVVERPSDMSSFFSVSEIDRYYEDCVIGGNGAFTMPVRDRKEFTTAIRRKLINEIAGRLPVNGKTWQAQLRSSTKRYDCLAGEKLWDAFQKE